MARASSGGSSAKFWLALSVSCVPMRPWWRVTTRACRTAVAYSRQEASFKPKLKKELRRFGRQFQPPPPRPIPQPQDHVTTFPIPYLPKPYPTPRANPTLLASLPHHTYRWQLEHRQTPSGHAPKAPAYTHITHVDSDARTADSLSHVSLRMQRSHPPFLAPGGTE
jgi:hypothetical protein